MSEPLTTEDALTLRDHDDYWGQGDVSETDYWSMLDRCAWNEATRLAEESGDLGQDVQRAG